MKAYVGAGWYLYHVSDRVVELRKDSYEYRRFTGRDGYVRTRIDPEMTRSQGIEKALTFAAKNDEALALRLSKRLLPSAHALAEFQGKQVQMARVFGVKDEERKVYRV